MVTVPAVVPPFQTFVSAVEAGGGDTLLVTLRITDSAGIIPVKDVVINIGDDLEQYENSVREQERQAIVEHYGSPRAYLEALALKFQGTPTGPGAQPPIQEQ